MVKTVGLLGVPSSMGAFAPGQEKAPRALRHAGLLQQLDRVGMAVADHGDLAVHRWYPDPSQRTAQHAALVAGVARETAQRVERIVAEGQAPLVLGGDCTIELGTVAGFLHGGHRVGLIYFDLHPDLDIPSAVPDGALDWMGLAHLIGEEGAVDDLLRVGPTAPMLDSDAVVLLGYGPGHTTAFERAVVDRRGIRAIPVDAVVMAPAQAAEIRCLGASFTRPRRSCRAADSRQVKEVLMPAVKMHADEVDTDVSLVGRMLAAQFPRWADFPIEPVHSAGTDNALYRLGDDMAVRLPRIHGATGQVDKEHRWLPRLAPLLPLAIPVPLAKGTPGAGYPWHWSVYRWLEGENATIERIADPGQAATELAQFVAALQRIDPTGGPPPGPHNSFRGVPLAMRDASTRAAIASLHGTLDGNAVTAAWEATLQAPAWHGPPVWLHGDLQSGNLLARQGQLSAVIDFGCLGVGDPACDLLVAWNLLSAETRDVFRAALPVDDATWARGRGWALSAGLIALPYYQSSNPVLAGISRRAIDEVLADHKHRAGHG